MIVLLDKLMLALKAVQEYFNIELKKISARTDEVQDDLKLTKDELGESQSTLDSFMNETKTNINSVKLNLSSATEDLDSIKSDLDSVTDELGSVKSELDNLGSKMDYHDPKGSGSFSMQRMVGTEIGRYSHAVGFNAEASGECSHAEGYQTIASGIYSHAEGEETKATGYASHAEGYWTRAEGSGSHAEGISTRAIGSRSHAEGNLTEANGDYSHAEGEYTKATGESSHAEGEQTIANGRAQHVQGELNIEDIVTESYERGKYAHIVGNGSSIGGKGIRSNAHTLDWNGVGWFQGGLQVGGNAQDDGAKNVLLEGVAVNNIILKDIINGYEYIINMQNGNLVSSCKLDSIQVSTMPIKTNYIEGEAFDKTGMIVTAIYQDGTTKIVDNYTCDEGVLSGKDITISYEEYDIVCTTTISANNFTVVPFDPSIHLIDFDYTENADGTYTITGWKQTLNGEPSTEMIVPNITFIVV